MKIASLTVSAALLAGVSTVSLSVPSFAQAAAAEDESRLDEIIVTANKRAENLQQTPLAITAVTAGYLVNRAKCHCASGDDQRHCGCRYDPGHQYCG
jgi:outer membrane receptor for ferrienterochelin and colicin